MSSQASPGNVTRTPREQAWIALSELFRDTEITERDIHDIATTLCTLGFDVAAAEKILKTEVAPVFGWNLLAVAGNWTGWRDEDAVGLVQDWLAARTSATFRGAWMRSPLAASLREAVFYGLVKPDWQRVARAIALHNNAEADSDMR
jgi:hypothetical protein